MFVVPTMQRVYKGSGLHSPTVLSTLLNIRNLYQTVDNECLVMINSTLTMDKRTIIISGLLTNGYFKLKTVTKLINQKKIY